MSKRYALGHNLRSLIGSVASSAYIKRQAVRRLRRAIESLETRTLLSATYYVSPSGADNAPGTLAQPLRTIQDAANIAQSGDTVEIEAGTYHETVTPANSGVTFTNYDNQSVTISGADPVTGFVNYSGSVYEAPTSDNLGEGFNQVFVNGQMMNEARWPNTSLNVSNPTEATIGSYSNGFLYDSSLTQAAGYWDGAIIHITPGPEWTSYTGTVLNSGPGWLQVSLPSTISATEAPVAGNSYYLSGKFQALDSAGEWYIDSNSNLYLWDSAGTNPNNADVEVKARDYGFNLAGVSNTTIEGISLFACTIHTDWNSNNTVINGITAQYITQFSVISNGWVAPNPSGIELYGSGSILENSVIAFSAGDGVMVAGTNVTVTHNIIHDVDYSGTDDAAILDYGQGSQLTDNLIYNAGRDGINFQASNVQILNNTIHDCMLQTADGGGIYTIGTNGDGSVIAYNDIYNITVAGPYTGAGIMLDNNSSGFIIHDNTTENVDAAMKVNFTSYNEQIYNNTFGANQYTVQNDGSYDWSGSEFYDNVSYNSNVQLGQNVSQWGNTYASGSPALPVVTTNLPAPASPPVTSPPPPPPPPPPATITTTSPPVTSTPVVSPPVTVTPVVSPPPPTVAAAAPASPPVPIDPGGPVWSAKGFWRGVDFWKSSNVASSYGAIGYTYGGSWVEYGNVDFGTGVSNLAVSLSVPAQYAGQKVEFRVGSLDGPVIATLIPQSTGGWNNFQIQTTSVAQVSGVQNLFIDFVGSAGICNLYSWQFS